MVVNGRAYGSTSSNGISITGHTRSQHVLSISRNIQRADTDCSYGAGVFRLGTRGKNWRMRSLHRSWNNVGRGNLEEPAIVAKRSWIPHSWNHVQCFTPFVMETRFIHFESFLFNL